MSPLVLHAVILVAAFLQGTTGIGFALIAAPAILLARGDGSAFQIASLLSLLIAVALIPGFFRQIDRPLLRRFTIAALVALPAGLALFALATPVTLKLICGVFVAGLTLSMVIGPGDWAGRPGRTGDLLAGVGGGLFGGALSMMGPTVSIRMTAARLSKVANRATVLAFFVLGYPIVFIGQSAVAGIAADTLWATLWFVPATLAGAIAGHLAMPHVSEALFRKLVILLQTTTATSLLVDAARNLT